MRQCNFTRFPEHYPNGKCFTWMHVWDLSGLYETVALVLAVGKNGKATSLISDLKEFEKGLCASVVHYDRCGPLTTNDHLRILPKYLGNHAVFLDPKNLPPGLRDEINRRKETALLNEIVNENNELIEEGHTILKNYASTSERERAFSIYRRRKIETTTIHNLN